MMNWSDLNLQLDSKKLKRLNFILYSTTRSTKSMFQTGEMYEISSKQIESLESCLKKISNASSPFSNPISKRYKLRKLLSPIISLDISTRTLNAHLIPNQDHKLVFELTIILNNFIDLANFHILSTSTCNNLSKTLSSIQSKITQIDLKIEDYTCPICLEILLDPIHMPCNHRYCKTCISEYHLSNFNEKQVDLCPLCRQEYDINECVVDYSLKRMLDLYFPREIKRRGNVYVKIEMYCCKIKSTWEKIKKFVKRTWN